MSCSTISVQKNYTHFNSTVIFASSRRPKIKYSFPLVLIYSGERNNPYEKQFNFSHSATFWCVFSVLFLCQYFLLGIISTLHKHILVSQRWIRLKASCNIFLINFRWSLENLSPFRAYCQSCNSTSRKLRAAADASSSNWISLEGCAKTFLSSHAVPFHCITYLL